MPHHCCVPKCGNNSEAALGLSWHGFPSNDVRKKLWLTRIKRDENTSVPEDHPEYFKVGSSTKVCSAHFKAEDYHNPDSQKKKRKRKKKTEIERKNLKTGAAPSVFVWANAQPERKTPAVRDSTVPPPKKRKRRVEDMTSTPSSASSEPTLDECSHCDCWPDIQHQLEVLKAEKELLEARCALLDAELAQVKLSAAQSSLSKAFGYQDISGDDKLVNYYTGFSSGPMFMAVFNFLKPTAEHMRMWRGSASAPDTQEQHGAKPGPKPKLSLLDQFFLVMVRLRLALGETDISFRFKVSQSTVSRLVLTWCNLMYYEFKKLPVWLSRSTIDKLMPPCFQQWYPSTRVIIDCTEVFINTPTSLSRQSATWSSYKNHNTVKILIGIAPHGHVTFVSDVYEGSISDKAITEASGVIEVLQKGDSVMADKGFEIKDLLAKVGVRLNIPPFKSGDRQLLPEELMATKKIAAVRIHVERKMQRIKAFRILAGEIESTMFDHLQVLVHVCAMLTNFEGALVA